MISHPNGDLLRASAFAKIEADGARLGVDIRTEKGRSEIQFFVHATDLRQAAEHAFVRWDHVRSELDLRRWEACTVTVTKMLTADADRTPRRSMRSLPHPVRARAADHFGRLPKWSPG